MDKNSRKKPNSKEIRITKEDLMNLDKNDLIEKIIQLKAHNVQLKNIIAKNEEDNIEEKKNHFDFNKAHFRKVLLKIMYFGWDYKGLAIQEDTNKTIEHYLFSALKKSCLIQSRETCQYHRCGRTDKGVSSYGQVISLKLRSKFPTEKQHCEESLSNEMQYCKILNRLLPADIRAVAWMDVDSEKHDFSARFDCKSRLYKYYFPRGGLNVAAMSDACSRLVGSHDFRHLCKMDVGNGVTEFRRQVFGAEISPVDEDGSKPTSMYCFIIEANAFLWHQIRCIMGLLLLVGAGKEQPSIITELLDVEKLERKPQYSMALDLPLNLFKCRYGIEEEKKWIYDKGELKSLISHLQSMWTIHNIKSKMINDCLGDLGKIYEGLSMNAANEENFNSYTDCLMQGVKSRVYKPLLERQTCSSLEERIEHYRKRRKFDETTFNN